jgi:hypothetical protein
VRLLFTYLLVYEKYIWSASRNAGLLRKVSSFSSLQHSSIVLDELFRATRCLAPVAVFSRRNAVEMLRLLPAVFDLRDVEIYLEIGRAVASIYCARWSKRGLIVPVGPRAGVFYNVILEPNAPSSRIHEAVRKRSRLPVVAVGAFALHQHGWTTQRPYLIALALPRRTTSRTVPKMTGIATVLRARAWFHVMLPLCTEGVNGFALPPEYVLVDALSHSPRYSQLWRPTPSDIDLPARLRLKTFLARMRKAAFALGQDVDAVRAFAGKVGLRDTE